MPKLTPADIRAAHKGHFFEATTMRFFGDTMRSFRTEEVNGETYLVRHRGRVARWRFNPETGELTGDAGWP